MHPTGLLHYCMGRGEKRGKVGRRLDKSIDRTGREKYDE